MTEILCFQFIKCEELVLFFVTADIKLNIVGFEVFVKKKHTILLDHLELQGNFNRHFSLYFDI